MAANEVTKYIGKVGYYVIDRKDEFAMRVTVVDAKFQYGRVDVLVEPTDGKGKRWVSLQNVTLDDAV